MAKVKEILEMGEFDWTKGTQSGTVYNGNSYVKHESEHYLMYIELHQAIPSWPVSWLKYTAWQPGPTHCILIPSRESGMSNCDDEIYSKYVMVMLNLQENGGWNCPHGLQSVQRI